MKIHSKTENAFSRKGENVRTSFPISEWSGKVNACRRRIMQFLTSGIDSKIDKKNISDLQVKRIFVSRPNGRLGNMLLATPFIEEIEQIFPECRLDLFVKGGVADLIFKNDPHISRIIALPKNPFGKLIDYCSIWLHLRQYKYDLSVNICGSSSSGRLSTKFSSSGIKFFNDEQADLSLQYADYRHMAKNGIYNFRKFLRLTGFDFQERPIPFMNLRLSDEEKKGGRTILKGLFNNGKETICIYTFATGNKCYPKQWWKEFYGELKNRYGEKYNLLEVLPVENVSSIDFAAPSFYSKNIREMAAVIGLCRMFITADCGIMHLASSAGTPTIGLFSCTDIAQYRPYNPGSIAFDTRTAGMPEILEGIDLNLNELKEENPF